MSNNDSFIEEVTEEVRRDKLYLFLKRYGWIGLVFILSIIFASIVTEIRSSNRIEKARNFGDALAISLNKSANKNSGSLTKDEKSLLNSNPVVGQLFKAVKAENNGDSGEAIASYREISNQDSMPLNIKDFAKLKIVILSESTDPQTENILLDLISPNNPFYLLALEQKVMKNISDKNWIEADSDLDLILTDPNSSQNLKFRASQLKKSINLSN